jgi:hypothetical protein
MIHLPFQRVNHRSHQAKTQESDFQSGALGVAFWIVGFIALQWRRNMIKLIKSESRS